MSEFPVRQGLVFGQKGSIGTTAVALSATDSTPLKGVQVKALAANGTNKVYVGYSDVTTATGFELSAGEGIFIPTDHLTSVYAISTTTGQAVSYMVY